MECFHVSVKMTMVYHTGNNIIDCFYTAVSNLYINVPCSGFRCNDPMCPFDHRNKLLNDNDFVRHYIGEIGYRYFDTHRKYYLGLASYVTLFALFLTTWGCFALFTDAATMERTYWAGKLVICTSFIYFLRTFI